MFYRDLAQLHVASLEIAEGSNFGIVDVKFGLSDGQSLQGGFEKCVHSVPNPRNLRSIEAVFNTAEYGYCFLIFTDREGNELKVGRFNKMYNETEGRRLKIEFEEGEQLLGCALYCEKDKKSLVRGIQFLKWTPPQL